MEKKPEISEITNNLNNKIKFGVLILLCIQNAGHALLARYSTSILKERYSSSEVVLVSEIIKLIFSTYLTIIESADPEIPGTGFSKLIWLLTRSTKVIILVILYSIANLLSYYALARVEASVYTVLLQLKILTTAGFSVVFLGRSFSGVKWRALFLLVLGCILVASPTFNRCDSSNENETDDEKVTIFDAALGVGAILVMVSISGYTAVYLENMLKKEKITVWERNFQLAFFSTFLLICYTISERMIENQGFENMFQGWTINAIILCLIQAGGGLLVAATLKYADSILKTLATSGSIAISAILGYLLLGAPLDIFVVIGCVSTILAIFNYTLDPSPITP